MDDAIAGFEKSQDALRAKLELVLKTAADDEARRKKERGEASKAKKEVEKELDAEREVTKALAEKVKWVKDEMGGRDAEMERQRAMIGDLEDQMRDLMFALSARDQIEAQGGASEAAGGDISVPDQTPTPSPAARRKKKR